MLTPQEVSTHAFTKAVMGGYNMAMVDEFLDELTADYTALYKENAGLKAKMKVLVEKVEDYRATEDSMRATLLTAQKMADSIVHEAESKRAELMAQAESQAQEKIGLLRQEKAEIDERLRAGQRELAGFVADMRAACARQMEFLDQLPQMPVELPQEPAAPVEEKAQEIEETVLAAFAAEPEVAEEPEQPEETYSEEDPFAAKEPEEPEEPEVSEPTRRINLSDLKFGRNYQGNE